MRPGTRGRAWFSRISPRRRRSGLVRDGAASASTSSKKPADAPDRQERTQRTIGSFERPCLLLGGGAGTASDRRAGVRAHPVGDGLDQVRSLAAARPVAARRAWRHSTRGCRCRRSGCWACRSPRPPHDRAGVWRVSGTEMAQWLFCRRNTTGAREESGEDHRLVPVALGGCAVAEGDETASSVFLKRQPMAKPTA